MSAAALLLAAGTGVRAASKHSKTFVIKKKMNYSVKFQINQEYPN